MSNLWWIYVISVNLICGHNLLYTDVDIIVANVVLFSQDPLMLGNGYKNMILSYNVCVVQTRRNILNPPQSIVKYPRLSCIHICGIKFNCRSYEWAVSFSEHSRALFDNISVNLCISSFNNTKENRRSIHQKYGPFSKKNPSTPAVSRKSVLS